MVHDMIQMAPAEDLSASWCNCDPVTTSVMEAISFITPVAEKFFIVTVAEGISGRPDSELVARCSAFMREESSHSRWHGKFNASLLDYLDASPPGLAMVQSLLKAAKKHLSLANRLLLVAAMEHFNVVLSKGYLRREGGWDFRSVSAKRLFARHAREELDHRSVVFDLWSGNPSTGRVGRALTMLAFLIAGFAYVSAAVPWITYRKTGRRLGVTLAALARGAFRNCLDIGVYSKLGELFSFARGDYHPDRAIEKGVVDGRK